MGSLDFKTLVGQLGADARRAFEAAAERAAAGSHVDLTVAHLLVAALEDEASEAHVVLRRLGLVDPVARELAQRVGATQTGAQTPTPSLEMIGLASTPIQVENGLPYPREARGRK